MTPVRYPESGHVHPYPTGEDIADPVCAPWRIWIPENPILVLGYSQEPEYELNTEAVQTADVPVYKRRGGGGAVFLSKDSVCVALRFRRKRDLGIPDYFAMGNGFIQNALQDALKIELKPRGISDLAWMDRKVLGSSLHLPRDRAIYLASILVDTPLDLLDRFLRHPSREPDYRQGRAHADFIRNLAVIPGLESLTPERVREILAARLSGFKNPDLDWPEPID